MVGASSFLIRECSYTDSREDVEGKICVELLDNSNQTTNCGRSVDIYEEVWTVQHVSVASQNRRLITSSTAQLPNT